MSRLKELLRIEAAIAGSDAAELDWAIALSSRKLKSVRLKQSIDMWRKVKVRARNRRRAVARHPDR